MVLRPSPTVRIAAAKSVTPESGAPTPWPPLPSAPWQIPVEALDTEQVRIGLQEIVERRPTKALAAMDDRLLRLPGL